MYLTSDLARSVDDDIYRQMTQLQKDKLQKLDKDGNAYQAIGVKCFFCKDIISKKDVLPPRQVYNSVLGSAHGDCLKYIVAKYPDHNILEFEGKVIRQRVEGLKL